MTDNKYRQSSIGSRKSQDSLHILVVDDDRRMVKTIRDILEVKDYQCDTAYSAGEAL